VNAEKGRCSVDWLLWVLIALLVLAPKGSSLKAARLDLRALILLVCVIALLIRP
jgi:hypothetical protein